MPYLDHAASNPTDPRVIDAMTAVLGAPGNPSSVHGAGRRARTAVDAARKDVASLLGVAPTELVFTSGATEANVTGLVGLYRAATAGRGEGPFRVLASPIEHASVRAAIGRLVEEHGAVVDELPVDGDGVVDAAAVRGAIREETVLVAVMWANNVFGAVQPIAEIAAAVRDARDSRGTEGLPLLCFSDAVQAVRTEDVRPADVGLDACAVSGHKMYGPKGVGVLWLRSGTPFAPTIVGGGQESGRRSGTENVAAIVGFGAAARILREERDADRARAVALRTLFLDRLAESAPSASVLGDPSRTVPGIVYALTGRTAGDVLAVMLDAADVAVSSGSACDAGTRGTASAVAAVKGGGVNGVRFSFGRGTTTDDVEAAVRALSDALRRA